MAKKLLSVPSTPAKAAKPKPNGTEISYWQSLSETAAFDDDVESLAPKAVHGLRRDSIRRKI